MKYFSITRAGIGAVALGLLLLVAQTSPVQAAILFQEDTFQDVLSPSLKLDSNGTGATNTSIRFGNNSTASQNGNITWNFAGNTFGIDHTVNIIGGLSATAAVDFSNATSFKNPQGTSDPATCTVGQEFYNTTSNLLKVCTATNTWISTISGNLIGRQTVTSGTTYNPTAGTKSIMIRLFGAGGGGGGATGTIVLCQAGGGGGSGGYAEKYYTGLSDATTYTIALGAAGAAGVAAGGTGGLGGDTTFTDGTTLVTAKGGAGGVATAVVTLGTSLGGVGGTVATNGDLNAGGQPGAPGLCLSGIVGSSGAGAPSIFGGGGNSRVTEGVGNAGGNFGAGGGGALSFSTAANAGGAGSAGVIVVWEFR